MLQSEEAAFEELAMEINEEEAADILDSYLNNVKERYNCSSRLLGVK